MAAQIPALISNYVHGRREEVCKSSVVFRLWSLGWTFRDECVFSTMAFALQLSQRRQLATYVPTSFISVVSLRVRDCSLSPAMLITPLRVNSLISWLTWCDKEGFLSERNENVQLLVVQLEREMRLVDGAEQKIKNEGTRCRCS